MADLNNMMVFLKVVELGSFTLAADAIGLPKSNISRKVTKLEQELGVLLLERSTRSLHLTEIGQVYYQHCQRIHEEMLNAEHCIDAMATVASGTIKLSCSISTGQALLAPLLAKFCQQYPLIKLDLNVSNRRVDLIDEGFDLLIRVGESPDSNLISKKVFQTTMQLFASDNYLTKSEKLIEPKDLHQHQCLFMNEIDIKPKWQLYSGDRHEVVNIKPSICCNDFNILKRAAEQGEGVVLLPHYFVQETDKRLQRVLPSWQGPTLNFYAVYPSRKGATPKIRALLDFLEEEFS